MSPRPNDENVAMHLAAIDPGGGFPVLVYWTDIDIASRTATIRGRLVGAAGPISADFDIARQAGSRAKWNLDEASDAYWYGDYRTGSGFHVPGSGAATYNYYPIWVQPDGTVRFTEVFFAGRPCRRSHLGSAAEAAAGGKRGRGSRHRRGRTGTRRGDGPVELVPQVVPMNAVPRGAVEREEIEEYGERARELHTAPPASR